MINKNGGGGTVFRFYGGGHSCYEGGHTVELIGGPRTRENPDIDNFILDDRTRKWFTKFKYPGLQSNDLSNKIKVIIILYKSHIKMTSL